MPNRLLLLCQVLLLLLLLSLPDLVCKLHSRFPLIGGFVFQYSRYLFSPLNHLSSGPFPSEISRFLQFPSMALFCTLLRKIVVRIDLFSSTHLLKTSSLDTFAVLLQHYISKFSTYLFSTFLNFHASDLYRGKLQKPVELSKVYEFIHLYE